MEQISGNCVYILKTGKNLYKIGKTQDLHKRLSAYHTHLPILFRVIRQYIVSNMEELEQGLFVVFQHKRLKGEWFELNDSDIVICDNIARNYALVSLPQRIRKNTTIKYSDHPLLQVMEANEKYLKDYSRIAEDIELGLDTEEIFTMYEGAVNKTVIETVRRLTKYRTPNADFLMQRLSIVNDLSENMTEKAILEKYRGQINRSTIQMIRRILKNQLY